MSMEQKAQQLQAQYKRYQDSLAELQSQHATISSQLNEHALVEKTLADMAGSSRKCFKMIGGVLTEKTVDEVLVLLREEKEELTRTQGLLAKDVESTKKTLEEWMKKNKVTIRRK